MGDGMGKQVLARRATGLVVAAAALVTAAGCSSTKSAGAPAVPTLSQPRSGSPGKATDVPRHRTARTAASVSHSRPVRRVSPAAVWTRSA